MLISGGSGPLRFLVIGVSVQSRFGFFFPQPPPLGGFLVQDLGLGARRLDFGRSHSKCLSSSTVFADGASKNSPRCRVAKKKGPRLTSGVMSPYTARATGVTAGPEQKFLFIVEPRRVIRCRHTLGKWAPVGSVSRSPEYVCRARRFVFSVRQPRPSAAPYSPREQLGNTSVRVFS